MGYTYDNLKKMLLIKVYMGHTKIRKSKSENEKKTAFVRARMPQHLKNDAEKILRELGITPTQAFNMLYKRIVRDGEWPVELKIPNEVTLKAIRDIDAGIGLSKARNLDELFEDLDI